MKCACRSLGLFQAWSVAALWLTMAVAFLPAAADSAPVVPDVAEEIARLRREIARHDALYHREAAPEISDYEYDRLKRRLVELERASPEPARVAGEAPAEIGDDRTGLWATGRHRMRMLSLEKAYTPEELRTFQERLEKALGRERLEFVVEPKFDGMAVSATYERGRLVRALTRGNGIEGDDITAHFRRLAGVPERLTERDEAPVPEFVEVRGEIFVPTAEFARVNAEREAAGEEPFATPRNLAAGTFRQRDAEAVRERGLRVVFYGVGACEPWSALPETQDALRGRLAAWGLPAIETTWRARTEVELSAAIEAVRRARKEFSFPTDGAVVKLGSLMGQREAGEAEATPRWAVAYKFAPERIEARVRAIALQLGRSGVVTPVAELDPVVLGGSRIARVTLHNRAEIARKDVRVGDYVWVEKAGEIIPAIVDVNRERRPATAVAFEFPTECPSCSSTLVEGPGAAAVRCPNAACPAQVQRRVEHFASRAGINISGLGPATIERLVRSGLVKAPPDLYRLTPDMLIARAGLGGKTAERLVASVAASRRAELSRVVRALGIQGVGAVAARQVAARCATLGELLDLPETDAPSRAVAAYFRIPENRAMVRELIELGVGAAEQ